MAFRITPHRLYELGRQSVQQKFAQSAQLQHQISSGLRVHKPSDDPRGQAIILNQKTLIQRYDAQLASVNEARTTLNNAHAQIRDAQQLVVQANVIASEARQATSESERDALAGQIDAILRQMQTIANSSVNGTYLFSGSSTGTKPFSESAAGQFAYQGNAAAGVAIFAGYDDVKTFYSGQEVFQPTTSGSLVISGTTGVANGAGTSSGSASVTLSIRHAMTTYSGASGIQPGASSVSSDTILGPQGAHQIAIRDTSGNGSAGTISLNGGDEIAWTSADADLRVQGPGGEVVFVNMQAIAAGYDGPVEIAATGMMSLDGGVTETPLNFSANQTLVHEGLGVVRHFDTTNVRSVGAAHVEPVENHDLFATLRQLKADLLNAEKMPSGELDEVLGRRLGDLERANDHLLGIIGQQSVSLEQLDRLQTRFEDLQLEAERVHTRVAGTDYATAIIQLQEQQNLLQYSLASLTSLSNISVLNFLS